MTPSHNSFSRAFPSLTAYTCTLGHSATLIFQSRSRAAPHGEAGLPRRKAKRGIPDTAARVVPARDKSTWARGRCVKMPVPKPLRVKKRIFAGKIKTGVERPLEKKKKRFNAIPLPDTIAVACPSLAPLPAAWDKTARTYSRQPRSGCDTRCSPRFLRIPRPSVHCR